MEKIVEPMALSKNWKDFTNESVLSLVFGKVDAKVILLSPGASPDTFNYGIIIHPYMSWELNNTTLLDAKSQAQTQLVGILQQALATV